MSKNYGFARCSLGEEKGQDLNRQVRELQAAGAEEIITERVHGDAKVKPQLDFLLEHIRISIFQKRKDQIVMLPKSAGFPALPSSYAKY